MGDVIMPRANLAADVLNGELPIGVGLAADLGVKRAGLAVFAGLPREAHRLAGALDWVELIASKPLESALLPTRTGHKAGEARFARPRLATGRH
jgi:hypothetical protein